MDDELVGSTAPMGSSPTGPNPHDGNTGLAGPAPDAAGPDAASLSAATDTAAGAGPGSGRARRGLSKPQPEWRDPADLPGVQRAHTGAFGEKLQA
ncbi:hypothetical protein E3O42_02295, partial [Cryobacterium adonitolivorans]